MHSTAGFPPEPSFASKSAEKSEQYEKLEKAKMASNMRSRSSQTSLLPPDLPPALAAQLVTVTSPRDLLSAHIASNDRRLRRLLCRYTNQIQYGCKNTYCTVPSCLTCRQRKSKTPLRKHTDATARALASHIIEEQGEKGLCHSDPVVPWFETPGSRPRTRSAEAKPKANGHVKESANGHSVGPATGYSALPSCKSPSTKSPTKVVECRQSLHIAQTENGTTRRRTSSNEQAVSRSHGVSEPSPAEIHPVPMVRRDTKSFTQAVFDSLRLRSLWTNMHTNANPAAPSPILRSENAIVEHQQDECHGTEEYKSKPVPGYPTTESQRGMQDPAPEIADNTLLGRIEDLDSQSPDEESSEQDNLEQMVSLSRTTNHIDQSDVGVQAVRSTFALEPGASLENPLPSVESQSKLESANAEDNTWIPDDKLHVQVAPFLSQDLLAFFTRWQFLILRESPIPWPDQWIPEPYTDFLNNSMFFCLRDSARTLRSIQEWHESLKKKDTYDSNDFDRVAVRRGVLRIASIIPLAETFRSLRLALADAYNLPTTWRAATTNRRKHQHRVQEDHDDDESLAAYEQEHRLSDADAARLCAFGLFLLEGGCATLKQPIFTGIRSGKNMKLPLEFVQICNSFAKVFPVHRLSYMKDPALLEMLRDPTHEAPTYRDIVGHITNFIDYFDDYDAKRLFLRITDLVAARHALGEMGKSRRKASMGPLKDKPTVAALIASYLISYDKQSRGETGNSVSMDATLLTIEWTRLLFAREWDGNAVIRRASSLGGSLQLLMAMFTESRKIALHPAHFYIPLIADRLNMVEMPAEWLSFRADNKTVHLLSYPFLFEPHVLVTCFRAINYSRMSKAAVDARAVQKDVRDFTDSNRYPGTNNSSLLLTSLGPYMANNFVITVRRDNLLQDAVDQIWRRQRRELMRPLKVRMGMDEGEEGIDSGGVQQEFFRILFANALNPDYAMFSIDERTRMTWFKPGSLEPLYKFEVLGIFMSLAIYNSITLPITFPLAFYRKLLGLKVKKVHQIADGWPELATGLQQMLDWSDGDVSDVFTRTYEFSYEAFGQHVNIDMKKFDKHTPWPPEERKKGKAKDKTKTASFELPPSSKSEHPSEWGKTDELAPLSPAEPVAGSSQTTGAHLAYSPTSLSQEYAYEEAPLVMNADREQYVKDYISWLTHRSIEPQYKAFAKGFYTCLDRTALSIFTPEALKAVIEGYVDIDLAGLEAVTKYEDGFDEFSSTVQDFWQIVRNFSTDQHRRLLEFVTASDRVPVNGIGSVQFIIQRNGSGDERLPTSMTCFGRLLLPQYSSRQVLEEKLTKAIENSEGFGVA